MKKALSLLTIGFISISLFGCSSEETTVIPPNDLGITSTQLDPISLESYFDSSIPMEQTGKVIDDTNLILVLGGSGSCPPVIEEIIESDNTVQVTLKSIGQEVCTADYRNYGFQLTAISTNFSFYDKTLQVCSENNCIAVPLIKS